MRKVRKSSLEYKVLTFMCVKDQNWVKMVMVQLLAKRTLGGTCFCVTLINKELAASKEQLVSTGTENLSFFVGDVIKLRVWAQVIEIIIIMFF